MAVTVTPKRLIAELRDAAMDTQIRLRRLQRQADNGDISPAAMRDWLAVMASECRTWTGLLDRAYGNMRPADGPERRLQLRLA